MEYEKFAIIFKALSDETRLKIFEMLTGGELCACKILESFKITQPTLSYHMKALCSSGLVVARRDGAWMRYSINKAKFDEIKLLIESINIKNEQSIDIGESCN